jgi:hypothetical protein
MSSNNAILIKKIGPKLEIRDVCVDTYPEYPGFLVAVIENDFPTVLITAINLAQKYMEQNVVEYGIKFEGIY